MKNIQFYKDWNRKLGCDVFSTIRRCIGLEDYYGDKIGSIFNVIANDKVLFPARLVSANLMPFSAIPPEVIMLDTGRADPTESLAIFESFYGKGFSKATSFYVLIFEKVAKK